MKRKQPRRRLISGLLTAALILAGIVPTAITAAPASAAVADVTLSKTVSASSALPEYPAGKSGDGNQNSYWESNNNAFPQWLQADLGAAVSVNRIVLKLPASWGARTQTLSVQGSTTGSPFTNIVASAGYNFSPTSANTVTISFPTITTRYVRLNITANTGWPAGQVSEFELYGPDTGGDPQAPSAPGNLALTEPSAGQIRLAWSASTDNVGVTGYAIYRNSARGDRGRQRPHLHRIPADVDDLGVLRPRPRCRRQRVGRQQSRKPWRSGRRLEPGGR